MFRKNYRASTPSYLQQFKDGQCRIIVTDSLLTRGLDALDAKYLINYDLPANVNEYFQRCSRIGRNGQEGVVITFVDEELLEENNRCLQDIVAVSFLYPYSTKYTHIHF